MTTLKENSHEKWLADKQAWLDAGCLCSECGLAMHIKKLESWFYCDNCGMVQFYHHPYQSLRKRPKRSVTVAAAVTDTEIRSVTSDKPKCAVCGKVLKGRSSKKTCSTKCRKQLSRSKNRTSDSEQ